MALPEVKTSEVGGTVSTKIINTIPQTTRNFLEFADVIPGVAFSLDPGNGTTKLQGGAQSASSINVYIDGVGQKNYVLQNGITGQDSSRGNPFPQLGIAEYKVITQNYKAEYDQLSQRCRDRGDEVRHERIPRRSVRHLHRRLPCAR